MNPGDAIATTHLMAAGGIVYPAPRGNVFVVLFLGAVDKAKPAPDVDELLGRLGWVRKEAKDG